MKNIYKFYHDLFKYFDPLFETSCIGSIFELDDISEMLISFCRNSLPTFHSFKTKPSQVNNSIKFESNYDGWSLRVGLGGSKSDDTVCIPNQGETRPLANVTNEWFIERMGLAQISIEVRNDIENISELEFLNLKIFPNRKFIQTTIHKNDGNINREFGTFYNGETYREIIDDDYSVMATLSFDKPNEESLSNLFSKVNFILGIKE